jgi:hypothetical protein
MCRTFYRQDSEGHSLSDTTEVRLFMAAKVQEWGQ